MSGPVRVPTLPGQDFRLPTGLEGLGELAYNLWWSWTPRAGALFARIDSGAWSRHRNPIPVLAAVGAARWSELLGDEDFMVDAGRLLDDFDRYLANGSGAEVRGAAADAGHARPLGPIAYFCAEYGVHESLQVYSGGLGILAGDHCKSASDAGLPLIGVGLLYRRGYFRQQIDADGHQEHAQPDLDPAMLPLRRARSRDGSALQVSIEFPGRPVHAAVWVAQVGRVPLLLLDTDVPANDGSDRPITHILYVRGREMRICQELVLGIGGVRALRSLGIVPTSWHLNEGHSAFLLLERARDLMGAEPVLTAGEALQRIGRNTAFTIHTPVAAGNEQFDPQLVEKHLGSWLAATRMPIDELLELGRSPGHAADGPFDMTAFVLRLAAGANAVSRLHAETATATWTPITGRPIEAITNGVHFATWVGRPMRRLYERSIGRSLAVDADGPSTLAGLASIPAGDLWDAHRQQKRELIEFVRRRLVRQFARHGESPSVLRELQAAFDPEALTIGFARRFATYKRADLLFHDEERLGRLLSDAERPMQILLAGKAHPADRPGQKVIQRIFSLSRSQPFRGRIFILEDYDMRMARFLVGGVDAWLNNPRRPLEASGTSGMKAALNAVPSVSVLDGWWDEGFTGENGWAIGTRQPLADEEAQDLADAGDLYRLLEDEVAPRFYARDLAGFPQSWIDTMRAALTTAAWQFSSARMAAEYAERRYLTLEVSGEPAGIR